MEPNKIDRHTARCVRCGKRANHWSGHVLGLNNEEILAGWCTDTCKKSGFVGHYFNWMRAREEEIIK